MSERVFRVGLAGWGLAGRYFHAPFIRQAAGLKLAHVITSRRPDPDLFPGITIGDDFDELLADDSLDLLVIATPNHLHVPQALAALAAGKHVVVEKPVAATVAEWEKATAAADAADRLLIPFHNRRWDGDFRTVRRLLDAGILGPVHYFASHWPKHRPHPKPRSGWKGEPDPTAGVLFDLGSHLVDQTLHLFGVPATVYARLARRRPGTINDDLMHLHLTYASGLDALLEVDLLNAAPPARFHLRGRDGTFQKYGLDPQERQLRAGAMPDSDSWGQEPEEDWGTLHYTRPGGLRINGKVETLPGNYGKFYQKLYRALAHGAPPPVSPAAATHQLRILEAARRSTSTNQVETL